MSAPAPLPDPTDPSFLSLGGTPDVLAALHPHSGARPGRVCRVDRGACTVWEPRRDVPYAAVRAELSARVLADARRDPTRTPAVGDWVALVDRPDGGADGPVVVAVLPRRTAVVRATVRPGSSAGQVLAANVDVVAVVEPFEPEPDLGRIERLLALAWSSGARPVVLLTKADLSAAVDDVVAEVAAAAPGADVRAVSVLPSGSSLAPSAALEDLLGRGATLVLLGPSGAGKSSLVNALAGVPGEGGDAAAEELARTGRLRADGKGRHTTAHRELVPLPGGALLADTPGLRSVGMRDVEEGLAATFADVDELAGRCRFPDCSHGVEPGCAVLEAVEAGELPQRRLASWRKLQREAAWMARRQDARLMAEERARWKQVHLEVRRSGRIRR